MKGFTIYGRGGHLGHVTQMPRTNFRSPYPRRLQNLALIGQAVSEKKMFEIVDDGRTDGQTDAGALVYYKLTYEPSGQVSKNRSSALVAKNNEIADLLLCCSHTVVNGILSHHAVYQLITEQTVGMVVFLYCTPHFYIVKLAFTGVLSFLFLLSNIADCGYTLEPPLKHRLLALVRTASV